MSGYLAVLCAVGLLACRLVIGVYVREVMGDDR